MSVWEGLDRAASIEPPAILEVATLEGMFGVGLAKVSWAGRGVGYCAFVSQDASAAVAGE